MFGSLSFNEILFIMVLALLIFGPKRLPQIGRTIGKTLGEFRRATSDLKRSMEVEMTMAEERETAAGDAPPRIAAGTEARGSQAQETGVGGMDEGGPERGTRKPHVRPARPRTRTRLTLRLPTWRTTRGKADR